MNRNPSRRASPTGTAFSGISNYRTESYRNLRDTNVPPVPAIDYRSVSQIHFNELDQYLAAYLAKAAPNSRSTARQKLTRLTIQQFHELSTDVYDELVRRKNEKEVPFLPVREEFHPKRNQARQKLATLPITRFEDLSSDVYFELARRYPEFKEEPSGNVTPGSNYDDYPVSDFPNNSPARAAGRTSADRPGDSGYGGSSVSSRRPSEDRRRPSESEFSTGRRSADTYNGRTSGDDYAPSSGSRRKPSQDTTRRSEDREREYRPGRGGAPSVTSDSSNLTAQQSTTATSGMIIPNKSTIEEEYIEVPYGREARESGSSTIDDRDRSRDLEADPEPPDSASDYPISPQSPPGGLSALSQRFELKDEDEEPEYGRRSVGSSERDRGSSRGGRASVDEQDKARRDYEYRIATMQTQLSTLQRERDDADERGRQLEASEERVRQMEEELDVVRRRGEEQTTAMRALQRELEELRETRLLEQEREARQAQEDEEELRMLRERCDRLEEEAAENAQGGGGADPEIVDQLRSDMEGLLTELSDLSRRNDELMTAKDADLVVIRDLDSQLKDYKRKYEAAKTELRSVKATSQLFLQAPKMDRAEDQLPVTADGGVLDLHITAFLSAVDGLLTAGRSNAPSRVLTPMKAVVNAVSSIIDDVRAFETRPARERSDVDADALMALRERAEATLSNLVAASKTHATSAGMSPVSLLDAAASHVAATVTDIGRTVCIRKATRAEQEQASASTYTPASSTFSPSLKTVDEGKTTTPPPAHQRKPSAAMSAGSMRSPRITDRSPMSPSSTYDSRRRRPPSDNSSSENTNSPPPIFDQPANDSAVADGSEDAWAELKPYLEAQTESIVYAIQSVLSGVRSPTPSPTLNENLTQIITIVSSIVAVCNDNLPPATAQQGNDILRELSEHANKLSEVQALPEVTKESRQVMAKSSFAIANAMKGLMKL
ncbi:hypothetical protein FB45DRAFT_201713 [Roridomyces roridus]|uniref:GIT Spa2 homology (SHD) domain-containing protein n=1 Tax=Roridomyces roridus TaxID=1738132 RepID=A0AAD7G078_9AGAR|nr:hypothetical protein FB45DRAFT_201713 [Roridomyces roridus]